MFENLLDLRYERKWFQVLGFYISYLVLIFLIGFLIGWIYGIFVWTPELEVANFLGRILALIFCLILSFLILWKKGIWNNFFYIVLFIFSGILSLFLWGIWGLIPIAYLTTVKPVSDKQATENYDSFVEKKE